MIIRKLGASRDSGKYKNGFTLVEVIVVLVILAILAAILIPSMVKYIGKAEERTAIVECRQCVNAAQTIASEAYGEHGTATLDLASYRSKIIDLAETPEGSDITQLTVENAKVALLQYCSADKVYVTYKNGKYTLGEGVSSTIQTAQTFLEKALAQVAAYNGKYHSGDDLIRAMGTLPSVATSEIFGNQKIYGGADVLYWRPAEVTINGEKTVVLYANSDPAGRAQWQGFAYYYNGKIYRSTAINNNSNTIDKRQISTSTVNNKSLWEEM